MKYFFICDGASVGNGISTGIGVVIKDENGENVGSLFKNIGQKSNNDAEYTAIIEALKYAIAHSMNNVVILTDSNLIHKQIIGEYKAKEQHLKSYIEIVKGLKKSIINCEFDYVPREYTHEADELARKAAEKGADDATESKYPFLKKQ